MLLRPYVYVSLSYSFCQNKDLILLFKVNCKTLCSTYHNNKAPPLPPLSLIFDYS